VDDNEVGRYWDRNAPAWTQLARAGYDTYRDLLNTPAFLDLLPDVTGLTGLDVGCGEGSNTRLVVAGRGARMYGVDISPVFVAMSEAAGRELDPPVRSLRASGQALPFGAGSFDFAVAFMSLMDMPRPDLALAEMHRVVRPGGFVQFSIEHPFAGTPVREWLHDEDGNKFALAVGGYFEQGESVSRWIFSAAPQELRASLPMFETPRFRRTLADWLNLIAAAGWRLEEAAEPLASEATVAAHPDLADTRIVPYFLHVRARRS
jgi:SAM-dependent methyltransferase